MSPSMNFIWGMAKKKCPVRVINLARFTGKENREKVIEIVDANREKDFGGFNMKNAYLYLSDHYMQSKNPRILRSYSFSD